jgi:hypothetical protein
VGGSLALQFLALAIRPRAPRSGSGAPLLSVVLALVAAVSVVLVNDIARLVMRWESSWRLGATRRQGDLTRVAWAHRCGPLVPPENPTWRLR